MAASLCPACQTPLGQRYLHVGSVDLHLECEAKLKPCPKCHHKTMQESKCLSCKYEMGWKLVCQTCFVQSDQGRLVSGVFTCMACIDHEMALSLAVDGSGDKPIPKKKSEVDYKQVKEWMWNKKCSGPRAQLLCEVCGEGVASICACQRAKFNPSIDEMNAFLAAHPKLGMKLQ